MVYKCGVIASSRSFNLGGGASGTKNINMINIAAADLFRLLNIYYVWYSLQCLPQKLAKWL